MQEVGLFPQPFLLLLFLSTRANRKMAAKAAYSQAMHCRIRPEAMGVENIYQMAWKYLLMEYFKSKGRIKIQP